MNISNEIVLYLADNPSYFTKDEFSLKDDLTFDFFVTFNKTMTKKEK
ncbi:MAG: hypothetical protein GWP03_07105 [Proteobacteria bacterium]|nr:hypothetical protein [Pseudomonadota bacterium]